MSTMNREEQKQVLIDTANHIINRDNTSPYSENLRELARIALASLEREQIRHEHAKWSDSTFGCVGPIGPLKHLSKEALEAAAEPDDLSEWADMQFLLWDAQRRAGISDAEITAAMEDKLKINMELQWPEPKDGEPRLHIKEPGNSPVTPGRLPGGFTIEDAKELHENLVRSHISQALSGEKMKKKDRDADLRWIHGVIVQAAWFIKASLEQTALSGTPPVTPDGWISCSERMPDKLIPVMVMYEDGEMWSAMWNGNRWDDGTEYPDPHSVTHWREMPAAPKQEVKS